MFGYIRPLQGELKVRELERFKALYCGLCHTLGRKYGVAARFVLNYELVFLTMLLWDENEQPDIKRRRCIASPIISKRCCARNAALDTCAGYSMILTWWKLRDTIADETFVKAIPHRVVAFILTRAYKKAAYDFPGFNARMKEGMAALAEYEARPELSIDGASDKFARMLSAIVPESMPDKERRPMLELLYHLGRWVYIIDACDDYKDDVKAGRYNPVAVLYPPNLGKLPEEGVLRMKTTLTHSNNLMGSAFELLPETAWSETVRNIIYLGMPDACTRVFEGKKSKNGTDK
jgi:hypothetical protein